jgi:phage shock protein A
MNEIPEQDRLLSLAHRVLISEESLQTLARDHGVSETDLKRTVREYKKVLETLQRKNERRSQLTDLFRDC